HRSIVRFIAQMKRIINSDVCNFSLRQAEKRRKEAEKRLCAVLTRSAGLVYTIFWLLSGMLLG
ncbi:MAG: hypothetical protein J6Y21_05830, partial [Clostridia bacterium]|nr:hypothetical protein [Clostridia bacterium]